MTFMTKKETDTRRVAVIGAGAAGMMAACAAAEQGAKVILIERNSMLGMKLNITGKGRCNLTNNSTADELIKNTLTKNRIPIIPMQTKVTER